MRCAYRTSLTLLVAVLAIAPLALSLAQSEPKKTPAKVRISFVTWAGPIWRRARNCNSSMVTAAACIV